MNAKQIDWINILLMLVALVIAKKMPFELFLFSYAVFGPLHYLTEINWLRDRNYFSKTSNIVWIMLILALFISINPILNILAIGDNTKDIFGFWLDSPFQIWINKWSPAFVLMAFATSIALIYTTKILIGLVGSIIGAIAAFFLLQIKLTWLWIAIFTPTLVHVYVFTGFFMLYGALKNKSIPGIISVIVLIACSVYILSSSTKNFNYPSELTLQRFDESTFNNIVEFFREFIGMENRFIGNVNVSYIKVLTFIAFAYTYHYLNWFSKTSLIKWHEINTKKWLLILMVWAISISLYSFNYKLGFAILFLLSFLHVFLEFPLNVISIKGIIQELLLRFR